MLTVKQLQDKRAQAVSEGRQILERAEREGRALSAEETAHYDRIDAEVDRLNAELAKAERIAAAKLSRPSAAPPAAPSPMTIQYEGGMNVPQMLKGRRPRQIQLQPGTDEHLRAQPKYQQAFLGYLQSGREQLGLKVSQDNKGGYLTSTQFAAELIRELDDEVFMRQLATVLPPLGAAVSLGVPSLDTKLSAADWTAEIPASDISEDDAIRLGKRELMPSLLTKLVKVGMKFIRSSVINAEGMIRTELAAAFGAAMENAYLNGSGSKQPLGVFVASDLGVPTSRDVTASSATAFTADNLIDLLYNLKPQYQRNATGLFHRLAVRMARKLKDGNGQYLWQPGLGGQPSTILDRPYIQSEYAPSTFTTGQYIGMFADFSAGYWIADTLSLEVQVLNELFTLKNQMGYIGRLETDGMPVRPLAFSRLKLGS